MEIPRTSTTLRTSRRNIQAMIVAITEELQTALAGADDETLSRVAVDWSHSEDMDGSDPAEVTGVLVDLADLARKAADRGEQLYCWLSE